VSKAKTGSKELKAVSRGKAPKKYLSQTDVPAWSLEQAIRIPRAVMDEHAGKPTRPIDVALAMNLQPSTGAFRMLCGAAIAYGLTDGGYNAETIAITDLGKRVISQTMDDPSGLAARREAILRPRVIREFLTKYDGARMPREEVALKVLDGLGVPQDAAQRAYQLILEVATSAYVFKEINGVQYVDLHHAAKSASLSSSDEQADEAGEMEYTSDTRTGLPELPGNQAKLAASASSVVDDPKERKVFVSHGKKRDLVPQLKEFLEIAEFEPVVSVERESVSKPIPEKVMDHMRSCGAAIIHVDGDREVTNDKGEKEVLLNENVLIEIGAALALYRRRFILLVQNGARLPSNLQGLFEVRYHGDKMDAESALRLLKSLRDLKNEPITRIS
jgi:predicted nucleotide-binding protein